MKSYHECGVKNKVQRCEPQVLDFIIYPDIQEQPDSIHA